MSLSSPLVLAIGDSLIAGYGLAAGQSFPAQLERRLQTAHPGARAVNAGVSGDTTADVLRRLPRILSAHDQRPDLAILQVGPNDVLRQVAPARTRANLDAIFTELDRCGVRVVLTTIPPPAFLRQRTGAYAGIQEELAARPGVMVRPFFPEDVLGRPGMVLADGLHPNARAIAMVVDAMIGDVERALASDEGEHGRLSLRS